MPHPTLPRDAQPSLPHALLAARDHVLTVILPAYVSLGKSGVPVIELVIKPALLASADALCYHDPVQMLSAIIDLESIKL